jgi:hypothetical protein
MLVHGCILYRFIYRPCRGEELLTCRRAPST